MAKKNVKVAEVSIAPDGDSATFRFINGAKLVVDTTSIANPATMRRAALHGLVQKLRDLYAGADEKGWSIDDCVEVVSDTYSRIRDGGPDAWNKKGGPSGQGLVLEALSRLLGLEVDEVRDIWSGMDEATKKGVLNHPDTKAAVAELRAERARVAASSSGTTSLASLLKQA